MLHGLEVGEGTEPIGSECADFQVTQPIGRSTCQRVGL